MAIIHIDGKAVEVDGADNLLQACLSLGIDVPYFCYHPALGSVGSCRQCAVKQYNNKEDYEAGRGRLVMSCMVAPTNDMYISVDDKEAKDFRKHIVEFLMTNHPHDCPTCPEGGHCHLQDMTYMSGHNHRRYRFTKRTHHNQDLGPFIKHEMNRCIACYRCVRFYKDYAGGEDLGVYASNNRVYFGRDADGQLESEFSGNLTEVCPTGVFTDKTHADRYNRKWDMQYAPSICHGCSTGCNISAGERYGEIRRIENRYNHDVNGYFLCDRGRFGYGYVNRTDRPVQPLENIDGRLVKVNDEFALDGVTNLLKDKLSRGLVIGIGSPQASLESNFALKRLVGEHNYSHGLSLLDSQMVQSAINLMRQDDVYNVSVSQIEQADAVLILGEDITQTSARVALSVRQAAKNKAKSMATALRTEHWLAEPVKRIGQQAYSPIYSVTVASTKLDDIAKSSVIASPNDIAKIGYMVGDIIAKFADKLSDIASDGKAFFAKESQAQDVDEVQELAYHIAYDLIMADKPLLITGTSLGNESILDACGYITRQLAAKRTLIKNLEREYVEVENAKIRAEEENQPKIDPALSAKPDHVSGTVSNEAKTERKPRPLLTYNEGYHEVAGIYTCLANCNDVGVSLLGGMSLEQAISYVEDGRIDTVVVMENDLSNYLSRARLDKFLANHVIAIDHQSYKWHDKAKYVLSAASFTEADGTLVSAEGRAQRFFAAFDKKYYDPQSMVKESWRWLYAIDNAMKGVDDFHLELDGVIDDLVASHEHLVGIANAAPNADYRISGLKIAREPRRYSGRTAMHAPISIHEPMQPKDKDSALTFSMEGYVGDKTSPSAIPFAWSAGWNSPQAWNKFQEKVGGKLKGGDVGVRLFDELPRLHHDYINQSEKIVEPVATSIFQENVNLVPVPKLLAGSRMSNRSPVIAENNPKMEWLIGVDDADRWQIKLGDKLAVGKNDETIVLPVRIVDYLADGYVGYPSGQLPSYVRFIKSIKKVDSTTQVYVDENSIPVSTHTSNPIFSPAKEL